MSNSKGDSAAPGFVEAAQPKAGASVILDEAAECLRELHGDAIGSLTVERVLVGVFFTGVKFSDGSTGVAYTPPELIERASTRILGDTTRAYRGRKAAEMIEQFDRWSVWSCHPACGAECPIGYAVSARLLRTAGSNDLSSISELFAGRKVCMVGAIIPLLKKLQDLGAYEIAIIDKKKETRDEATLSHSSLSKTAETLEACQTAVFTGAAIANGTIRSCCNRFEACGDCCGLSHGGFVPTPLFRRGVAVAGTVIVTNGTRAHDASLRRRRQLSTVQAMCHQDESGQPPRLPTSNFKIHNWRIGWSRWI